MIFADFYWVWGNRFLAVVVYYDITAIFTTCSWIYTAGFYQVWWLYCSDHPYHSVNGEFATRKSKTKYVLKSCNIEFVNIFHHVFLLLTWSGCQWVDSFWPRPSKVNLVLLSGALHFAYTMHRHFYFSNILNQYLFSYQFMLYLACLWCSSVRPVHAQNEEEAMEWEYSDTMR